MNKKMNYLGVEIYHPQTNREKEFLAMWQVGPCQLCEKFKGHQVSIYFRPETNDYMATAHWNNLDDYLNYLNSPLTRPWIDKLNDLSREPSIHESYRIVEERAA